MSNAERLTDHQGSCQGREIVVGVCGGIAAYKVADVVSKLVQGGAGVTVCMTTEAQRFITPLTLEALSGRPVRTQMFDLMDSSDPQHIGLTERADLLLVAPATAHNLAKAAHGLCDDLISLLICASACPVLFAPAMNNRMWENPITRQNVKRLRDAGHFFIGPEDGWLACRNVGPGRMSEPKAILDAVGGMLAERGAVSSRPPASDPS